MGSLLVGKSQGGNSDGKGSFHRNRFWSGTLQCQDGSLHSMHGLLIEPRVWDWHAVSRAPLSVDCVRGLGKGMVGINGLDSAATNQLDYGRDDPGCNSYM